jgi:hypothetical protein
MARRCWGTPCWALWLCCLWQRQCGCQGCCLAGTKSRQSHRASGTGSTCRCVGINCTCACGLSYLPCTLSLVWPLKRQPAVVHLRQQYATGVVAVGYHREGWCALLGGTHAQLACCTCVALCLPACCLRVIAGACAVLLMLLLSRAGGPCCLSCAAYAVLGVLCCCCAV